MQSQKRQINSFESALSIAIKLSNQSIEDINNQLDELQLLAETAGAKIEDRIIQNRNHIDPATFIGKGKVNSIIDIAKELKIKLIIFNDEISPTQLKNIQKLASDKIKVIDRTGLILDIFDNHAKSREAKTQIKLARLEYMLPRLTRQWTHLERQMGGVGTRGGPGETQIEIDRRLIRNQINKYKIELEEIQRQHNVKVQNRKNIFKVALVGYTNAGKSTLMKAISGADVYIQDQLFATLDTTTRSVELEKGLSIVMSDTVGFIDNLPHSLIASFRSTLSEVYDANLILKVIDASSDQFIKHLQTIDDALKELDINFSKSAQLLVLNKVDLINDENVLSGLKHKYPDAIFVSAFKELKINNLKDKISRIIRSNYIITEILIPFKDLKKLKEIYSELIIHKREDTYNGIKMKVEGDPSVIEKIKNK